ncbi:MAG: hypothetical protein IID61_19205 [SAR324 cluster bacterium]|nr:hypothetical protein [SAR324 cluster bacterium]
MKVERIFLVACYESNFSNKTFYLAVYRAKTREETKFTICHSDREDSLAEEYTDRITFERAHSDPEWLDDLDELSDELEAFPWTRGSLHHALPDTWAEIEHLVRRTQAMEEVIWHDKYYPFTSELELHGT